MTEVPIIETSPLISAPNQWFSFYMIGTFAVKELIMIKLSDNKIYFSSNLLKV